MDYSQQLAMSYYKTIATIQEEHQVYLAQHQETGKFFVKKILNRYSLNVYRYLKAHPIDGIPRIIDFFEETFEKNVDGRTIRSRQLTIIEEYVTGSTLNELMKTRSLTPEKLCLYMINLCEILEKLHSLNPPILHRDIKPTNIIITGYDKVVLIDFNAAKLKFKETGRTSDTVLLGTPGYAAPEQFGFRESSQETDIFNIGITLQEAAATLSYNRLIFEPIISKCTHLEPELRYRSAKELKASLLSLLKKYGRTPAKLIPRSENRFFPPGFRTSTIWKILIAIPVYLIMIYSCFTMRINHTTGTSLWFQRIGCLFLLLGNVCILCNYLGVLDHFPLCRSHNKAIRATGIFLAMTTYSFSLMIVLVVFVNVLFLPN